MLLRWEINGGGQAFVRPLPASIPTPPGFRYEDLFFAPTADEGRAWEAHDVFQDLAVISALTTLWWPRRSVRLSGSQRSRLTICTHADGIDAPGRKGRTSPVVRGSRGLPDMWR
jgi:hypothetical protein